MEYSHIFIIVFLFLLGIFLNARRSRDTLPGPRGLPLIGNLFIRPKQMPWLVYTEWSKLYGDIFQYEILGQPVIVVNSFKAANELFEKRSGNYSDRPSFFMLNDMMKWSWDFCSMRYSDRWRIHRKTFQQYFLASKITTFAPVQVKAATTLLKRTLDTPENYYSHIRSFTGSVILRITYGYDTQDINDSYIELVDRAMRGVIYALNPGAYLVDYLPAISYLPAWFPFTGFKAEAKAAAKDSMELLNKPFKLLDNDHSLGSGIESFLSKNMEKVGQNGTREDFSEIVKNCAAIAFAGGADTTVSVVLTVILAMMKNPDIQMRAHSELDAVVGWGRIPDFSDQKNLPFVNAIVLEAMRWRPVTPLGMAHSCLSDDVYDGYFIAGGTTVFGNIWAILHDQEIYNSPELFNPDRFMGGNPAPDPTTIGAFGFGRRICPGRYLAMASAYIAVSGLLWAFDISSASDDSGKQINVDDMAFTDGLISFPQPFKCTILPRFPSVTEVVNSHESVN